MAQQIWPLRKWLEHTTQNSIAANDNALRLQAVLDRALGIADAAPGGSPAEDDQWVVGTAWGGFSTGGIVLRKGATWLEFTPFAGMLKTIDTDVYRWNGSAWLSALPSSAPGTKVVIVPFASNGAAGATTPANAGSMHRFSGTGAKTLTIDVADDWEEGHIVHVANRGASGNLTLVGTGITLRPPKGGTLVLQPGDTVSIHLIGPDSADVFGSTEDAP